MMERNGTMQCATFYIIDLMTLFKMKISMKSELCIIITSTFNKWFYKNNVYQALKTMYSISV